MRIMITGGSGFAAPHLIEYILSLGKHQIFVLVRQRGDDSQLDRLPDLDKIEVIKCDLLNYSSIAAILQRVKPEKIFHLAAQSYVKYSFEDPVGSIHNNIFAQLNLLEAVRNMEGPVPTIQLAGTSEEYGLVHPNEVPIKETNPLRPLSPYGVSKLATEMMGYQYFQSYHMPIILTRAFNHEGPKRGKQFFLSSMCEQVARIERGWNPPIIETGDLLPTRDITHVKDMVRAYWLATEKCEPGVPYNICSDQEITMRALLDKVISLSKVPVKEEISEARMRPSEVMRLYGDSTLFRTTTGWEPEFTIDQVVEDTLNYWRSKYESRS